MIPRRILIAVIALLSVASLGVLLYAVLAQGGWTAWKVAVFVCLIVLNPWLGLGPANGLIGFLILLAARSPARAVLAIPGDLSAPPVGDEKTAIAVTVRDETMAVVLPPLRRLLDGLDAAGVGKSFALFVLSDTRDAALARAEENAVDAFRKADPDPTRIRYRRRADNAGFKAGNVMDFLDHHADGFTFAVMLDADSEMSPAAVMKLVRIMRVGEKLGIVQHLTVGAPAGSAFPRLFQFGMRAGMRTWAVGQAWWQGDEGPYWGHNAILRIAPFREHCRLPILPDGAKILSHDQVEAALLRGAGWGVRMWAEEDGSYEANPPTLPEFLRRDERWMAGNLQYRHLLGLPGLRAMGRWQLIQAMLLFSGPPLYTAMLAVTAISVALGGGGDVPRGNMLALVLAWIAIVHAPKFLGYAEVFLRAEQRARYGGGARFAVGVVAESVFTLLLDAIQMPHKTLALARLALGRRASWPSQNRRDRGVRWAEAARLFWPHTLFGLLVFGLLAVGSWGAVLWALPFVAGLPLAIPFCVLTSDPKFSRWLRRRGVAAIPEEIAQAGASNLSMNHAGGSAAAASNHSSISG